MRWAALVVAFFIGGCHSPQGAAVPSSGAPDEAPETNRAVLYVKGAEAQFESPEQGAELRRALTDMSSLSAPVLCARRYADYALTPGKWTLAELLRHYLVPKPLQTIPDEAAFCRDAATPRARAVVREAIRSLDDGP